MRLGRVVRAVSGRVSLEKVELGNSLGGFVEPSHVEHALPAVPPFAQERRADLEAQLAALEERLPRMGVAPIDAVATASFFPSRKRSGA